MGGQGRKAARAFADVLRDLYVKAGAPTYAELIRQGRAQQPPVALSDASLSDWLNGKSAASKPEAVLFLVSYLQPKATKRTTYEPKSAYWWEQLRLAAVREQNAGRGGRPRTAITRNEGVDQSSGPGTDGPGVRQARRIEESAREVGLATHAMAGGLAVLGVSVDGVAAATRTLPRDSGSFTGREAELRQLVRVTAATPHPGGVVGIHAIGGMACWRRSGPGSPPSIRGSRATAAGQLGRIAKRPRLCSSPVAPAPDRGEAT